MSGDKIRIGIIGANPGTGGACEPICRLSWPCPVMN